MEKPEIFQIYKNKKIVVEIVETDNPKKKTRRFIILKTDEVSGSYNLGTIKWNGAWRQYCFNPDVHTTWSDGCLNKVVEFLTKLNKIKNTSRRRNESML